MVVDQFDHESCNARCRSRLAYPIDDMNDRYRKVQIDFKTLSGRQSDPQIRQTISGNNTRIRQVCNATPFIQGRKRGRNVDIKTERIQIEYQRNLNQAFTGQLPFARSTEVR